MPSKNPLSHTPRTRKVDGSADAARDCGQLLRSARAKIGMTRKQLAAASGTSERYLALLEGGQGNPSLGVLTVLALALDLPVVDLLPMGGEHDASTASLAAAVRRLPPNRLAALRHWLADTREAAPSTSKAERIVLIGLRGAGKTTLGKMLAEHRGVPFIEVSKMVEDAYGGDIGLLIEMSGQTALRRYENQVWDQLCGAHDRAVIAAPGGVVADAVLYDRVLASAHAIWLSATPEDHMSRVMAQGDFRPMTSNRGAMDDLKAILAARSAEYARADAQVNTSHLGLEESLAQLNAHVDALLGIGTA